jgi:hypothetical protein
MLSIDNVYTEEELAEFGVRVVKLIGPDPISGWWNTKSTAWHCR